MKRTVIQQVYQQVVKINNQLKSVGLLPDITELLHCDLEDIACMINKYPQGSTQHTVINLRLKHGVEAGDWEEEDLWCQEQYVDIMVSLFKGLTDEELFEMGLYNTKNMLRYLRFNACKSNQHDPIFIWFKKIL